MRNDGAYGIHAHKRGRYCGCCLPLLCCALLVCGMLAACGGAAGDVASPGDAPARAEAAPEAGVRWVFGGMDVDSGQRIEIDVVLEEPAAGAGVITKYEKPADPQAALDRWIAALNGGAQLYVDDGKDPASMYERVIGEYEAARALTQEERDAKYRWTDGASITESSLDSWIADYRNNLLPNDAFPDGAAREPATTEMRWDGDDECRVLSVYAHPTERYEDDVRYFSVDGEGFSAMLRDAGEEGAIVPLDGNARRTAEKTLAALGFADMAQVWASEGCLATNDPLETAEVTRFAYAQAVPCIAPMAHGKLLQPGFAGNYATLDVGKNGLTNFYLPYCMEPSGEPARSAALRPLDEAMQDELMGTLWHLGNYADAVAGCRVTRAAFGYAPAAPETAPDQLGEPYWLVPVWRFYGELTFKGAPDEALLRAYLPYQREAYLADPAAHPLCLATVLAIDSTALPEAFAG